MVTPHNSTLGLRVSRTTMSTGTKKIRNNVSELGRFMGDERRNGPVCGRSHAAPHYRLRERGRQRLWRAADGDGFCTLWLIGRLSRKVGCQSWALTIVPQTCANVGIRARCLRAGAQNWSSCETKLSDLFSVGYKRNCTEAGLSAKVRVSLGFRGSYSFHKFFHSTGNVLEARGLRVGGRILASKARPRDRFNSEVTAPVSRLVSDRTRAAQYADRQVKERCEQSKDAVYRDAEEAKRQGQQPNDWKQDDGEQRQRPAQDKQYAPEKKCSHG